MDQRAACSLALAVGLCACADSGPSDSGDGGHGGSEASGSTTAAATTTGGEGPSTATADPASSSAVSESGSGSGSGSESGATTGSMELDPIFAMDLSSEAAPDHGWPAGAWKTDDLGVLFDASYLEDGGPRGGGAVRLAQISAPEAPSYGGQFSWGWEGDVDTSAPDYGDTQYYRLWMRVSDASDCSGVTWSDGLSAESAVKLLTVGAYGDCESGGHCRFILHMGCSNVDQRTRLLMTTDAEQDFETDYLFERGAWMAVQLRLEFSSAYEQPDARWTLWVDDMTTPVLEANEIILNAVNTGAAGLGLYNNNGLAADGTFELEIGAFEIDETFDPSWGA